MRPNAWRTIWSQQFHQSAQHFVTIFARQCERELRGQQPVFDAKVVAAAFEFAGEVTFATGEPCQRGAKVDCRFGAGRGREQLGEDLLHRRREHMHSEKAQVVARAQAGHVDLLLGLGRRRLLQHRVHLVEPLRRVDELAADRAVVRQLAFVRGLHRRDRTILRAGNAHELLRATLLSGAEVKMIAHEQQERVAPAKLRCAMHRVRVAEGLRLRDEAEPRRVRSRGRAIRGFVAGADDHADLLDAGAQDFLDDDGAVFVTPSRSTTIERQRAPSLPAAVMKPCGFWDGVERCQPAQRQPAALKMLGFSSAGVRLAL